MSINDLKAVIKVKRRSLPASLMQLPRVYRRHYRELRRTNGRAVSAYGAWVLARLVVTVR